MNKMTRYYTLCKHINKTTKYEHMNKVQENIRCAHILIKLQSMNI